MQNPSRVPRQSGGRAARRENKQRGIEYLPTCTCQVLEGYHSGSRPNRIIKPDCTDRSSKTAKPINMGPSLSRYTPKLSPIVG
jgi:hypothetical protein